VTDQQGIDNMREIILDALRRLQEERGEDEAMGVDEFTDNEYQAIFDAGRGDLQWLAEYAARMAADKRPRAEISGVEHALNIIQRIEKGRGK
jgi:predicted phage gp36 major capsid-like protein